MFGERVAKQILSDAGLRFMGVFQKFTKEAGQKVALE